MKKNILISIIFVLCAIFSFAQTTPYPNNFPGVGNDSSLYLIKGGTKFSDGFQLTGYPDTTTANKKHIAYYPGWKIRVGNIEYMRDSTAHKWIPIGTGSGGSGTDSAAFHTISQGADSSYAKVNRPNGTGTVLKLIYDTAHGGGSSGITQQQLDDTASAIRSSFYLKSQIDAFLAAKQNIINVTTTGSGTATWDGTNLNIPTPSIPAQFNPIAGIGVSLSGTYPNITFNATGTGGLTGGSIAWPGTLYTTPTTGTVSGSTITFTPSLASQSPYVIFNRGSGSGTPSFSAIDTNYFANNWAKYVRAAGTPVITKSPLITITHIFPDLYDSLGITQSGTSTDGYLSSIDWNRFNQTTDPSYRVVIADSLGNYSGLTVNPRKGLYLLNNANATASATQQNSPPFYFKASNYTGGILYTKWIRIYESALGVNPLFIIEGSTDSVTWTQYASFSPSGVFSPYNGQFNGNVQTPIIYLGNAGQFHSTAKSFGSFLFGANSIANPQAQGEFRDSTHGLLINRGSTLARIRLGTSPYKATITNGGSGYTGTNYGNMAVTGGSGTGALMSVYLTGGVVTSIIFNPSVGMNYKPGDVISAPIPGGTGFTAQITKVQGDTACGLLYTDTTLQRTFSWNCSNHAWDPLGQNPHVVFTPATGDNITTNIYTDNIVNPSGTIAALTITVPSNPANNDKTYFTFTQAVTAITWSGGTVVGLPTTAAAGQQFYLIYDLTNNTWY